MVQPSKLRIRLVPALLLSLLLASTAWGGQQADNRISTLEQLKADFDSVPCQNDDRLASVRALFEKMGAPPSDISLDKYKSVENLVVRKKGASEEKIVIGAHYDKVSEGCGAVDNWTGIVTLAHLYKTLKDIPLKKTLLFIAFGKEEKGLIGSHEMVAALKKEEIGLYCEMINIDSFGLAAPQVLENASSKKLTSLAAELAKQMKMPFASNRIDLADADSSSFVKKGIPGLTLHGLSNDFSTILHTHKDQSSKINPLSVYLGYRLALALTVRLSETPCGAYK